MATYAAQTGVAVDKSQAEIRATLKRYGATGFGYGEDDLAHAAMIAFQIRDRQYRLYVPLPTKDDARQRVNNQYGQAGDLKPGAYEQLVRQRWRAVALYVKAVLEAAESGIVSVESALLAHLVLPNGQTVGQATAGPIEEAYRTRQMPELLPGLTRRALPAPEA